MTLVYMFGGLLCLIIGAEALVRGASRIAANLGVSSLIIGLTVVALGTSAPELAVSMKAAAGEQASIAVGNVIGSNLFNILFILGLSALLAPLTVSSQFIRMEIPLLIAVSLGVWGLGSDGTLGRFEGALLLVAFALYTIFLIYSGQSDQEQSGSAAAAIPGLSPEISPHWWRNLIFVLGGLGLLVLGSRWLVDSAVSLAQAFGVSELVIGITIIAAGTSLPEVVTSVVAGVRGERDIAVGNVIGSNLINTMGVLGFAGVIAPEGIGITSAALRFDIPVMIVATFACLPIFFTDGKISRWEGGLLLGYYVVYTVYLLMAASHHKALPVLSAVLLYFALPLTVITLIVLTVQARFGKKGGSDP